MNDEIAQALSKINLPKDTSHKGQNGKLMIIGGSDLFHAASKWSLDVASQFVDMVFYASVPSNNELVQEAKGEFWNGIVINRDDVETYIQEADCILIGPGMTRSSERTSNSQLPTTAIDPSTPLRMTTKEWNGDTEKVINYLLAKYPDKKWVVDAGALQMVDISLLNKNCVVTPHTGEAELLSSNFKLQTTNFKESNLTVAMSLESLISDLQALAHKQGCTVLLKGEVDHLIIPERQIEIEGGNPGMTKGGTGDVLAGLIAALYCTHDAETSTLVGSYVNKKAGDELYETVGPFFNSSELVQQVPKTLWKLLESRI